MYSLINILTLFSSMYIGLVCGEIIDGCWYKIKNVENQEYLTVDESPPKTSYLAGTLTEPFNGRVTQLWRPTAISQIANTFWLFPQTYPLNIVSAYSGPPSPYPLSNLLKFKEMSTPSMDNKSSPTYQIQSLHRKMCLTLNDKRDSKLVSYEDCDENVPTQMWTMEISNIDSECKEQMQNQMSLSPSAVT